jgi:ribosome-binding factor A
MLNKARKRERYNDLLRDIVSSFIKEKIDFNAMVTVMRVETPENLRSAKIFISAFPEEKEKEALSFFKRKKNDLYDFVKPRLKMRFLPSFFFEIDKGIKLERKIEEILKK